MRTIFIILRKEFRQIFRHRVMLPLIFIMPVIQLLILSNAADYEVKNIYLYVIDRDQSSTSRRLVGHFQASDHFELVGSSFREAEGFAHLQDNTADLVLEIPADFERQLRRDDASSLHLSINAINGTKAGLANGYAMAIIQQFNNDLRLEWLKIPKLKNLGRISLTHSYWYNPELEYKAFMVPGILVMLVTLVGMFLSGMNIVKEKEIGTIEQINVTPIHKYQFIVGKLLPFWIIALVELSIGLLLGKLIFHIPIVGSLGLIYLFAGLYLLVVLGIGLLISTFTDTQQQAMFIAWFLLVIFILMSGLFTPIESMPDWAQKLTLFNPIAYFVQVMRMVMLKGSGLYEITWHLAAMAAFAVGINGLAIWNYRKTA